MFLSLITVGGLLSLVLYSILPEVKNPVSECSRNPGPLPLVVEVAGCSQAPCVVRHGEQAALNITFKAPHNIKHMTTSATAYLNIFLGIDLPIPCDLGEKAETCNHLIGTTCPVKAEGLIMYSLTIDIPDTIPTGISPIMEFSIRDDQNLIIACFSVPIRIKTVLDTMTVNNDTILEIKK